LLGLSGLGDVAVVVALILFTLMAMHLSMKKNEQTENKL
jgi:hypothetical protein